MVVEWGKIISRRIMSEGKPGTFLAAQLRDSENQAWVEYYDESGKLARIVGIQAENLYNSTIVLMEQNPRIGFSEGMEKKLNEVISK